MARNGDDSHANCAAILSVCAKYRPVRAHSHESGTYNAGAGVAEAVPCAINVFASRLVLFVLGDSDDDGGLSTAPPAIAPAARGRTTAICGAARRRCGLVPLRVQRVRRP